MSKNLCLGGIADGQWHEDVESEFLVVPQPQKFVAMPSDEAMENLTLPKPHIYSRFPIKVNNYETFIWVLNRIQQEDIVPYLLRGYRKQRG